MSRLDDAFAEAKRKKESGTRDATALQTQSARFYQLLLEEIHAAARSINKDQEKRQVVRGEIQAEAYQTTGLVVRLRGAAPLTQIIVQNHEKNISVDVRIAQTQEGEYRLSSSDVFTFALDAGGGVCVSNKAGTQFADAEELAVYILQPFWTS